MILKFGKYKGQQFQNTPKSYQDWLLKQDWFKAPAKLNTLENAQKNVSKLSDDLRGWDGNSSKGYAVESNLFEAEKTMDEVVFNSNDSYSSLWNGEGNYDY